MMRCCVQYYNYDACVLSSIHSIHRSERDGDKKKKKKRDYSIDFSGAVTESHMAERHDTT